MKMQKALATSNFPRQQEEAEEKSGKKCHGPQAAVLLCNFLLMQWKLQGNAKV